METPEEIHLWFTLNLNQNFGVATLFIQRRVDFAWNPLRSGEGNQRLDPHRACSRGGHQQGRGLHTQNLLRNFYGFNQRSQADQPVESTILHQVSVINILESFSLI